MINDNNYKEHFKGIQVVEISGESCANCLTLMPILHELVSKRSDATLIHVEASETTVNIMKEYEIDRVPTILLLDDGVEFARATGFQPEEILELWLNNKIDSHKSK
jgi:thiol-disulfide isomerase/thioredoxin